MKVDYEDDLRRAIALRVYERFCGTANRAEVRLSTDYSRPGSGAKQ